MKVTLQHIAEVAGVSPATVDRVINSRPGVRAETRAHVLSVARELGYRLRGTAGQTARLRFLLPYGTNSFIRRLGGEIERQAADLPGMAVAVEAVEGFDPPRLAERLAALQGQAEGLGIIALDHPLVREALRGLAAAGTKIVTLVSDIQSIPRLAYVGVDNRQAGRLAGYVIGRLLGAGRRGKVALFAGSLSDRGHQEREMGFRQILYEEFPLLEIVELREILDDRAKARAEALALLERRPDLAAIYNVGAGTAGIGAALKESGRAGRIIFVGHEVTADNKALLLDGTLDAVIDQNPRHEAREALAALAAAVRGQPCTPVPPRLNVIFRENLPEDL